MVKQAFVVGSVFFALGLFACAAEPDDDGARATTDALSVGNCVGAPDKSWVCAAQGDGRKYAQCHSDVAGKSVDNDIYSCPVVDGAQSFCDQTKKTPANNPPKCSVPGKTPVQPSQNPADSVCVYGGTTIPKGGSKCLSDEKVTCTIDPVSHAQKITTTYCPLRCRGHYNGPPVDSSPCEPQGDEANCNGEVVHVNIDRLHCGTCNTVCPNSCQGGRCK